MQKIILKFIDIVSDSLLQKTIYDIFDHLFSNGLWLNLKQKSQWNNREVLEQVKYIIGKNS